MLNFDMFLQNLEDFLKMCAFWKLLKDFFLHFYGMLDFIVSFDPILDEIL